VNSTQKQGRPLLLRVPRCLLICFFRCSAAFFNTFLAVFVPQVRRPVTNAAVQNQNLAQTTQRRPRIFMLIKLWLEIGPNSESSSISQKLLQCPEVALESRQRALHILPRFTPSTISETFCPASVSSITLPVTIMSAPADAAARACPLDRIPPPTISGTST